MLSFITLPFILAILLALSVHEWAHGYVAYRLGDPTAKYEGRLTLNPLAHLDPLGTLMFLFVGFGWGKPVPINPRYFRHYRRDTALVSIAGPLSNLMLAIASFLLLLAVAPKGFINGDLTNMAASGNVLQSFFIDFLGSSLFLNLGLMAFNLLPVAPLDGSKVLAAFLPHEYEQQYDEYMRYGPYILLALLVFGRSGGFDPLGIWIHAIIDPILHVMSLIG